MNLRNDNELLRDSLRREMAMTRMEILLLTALALVAVHVIIEWLL